MTERRHIRGRAAAVLTTALMLLMCACSAPTPELSFTASVTTFPAASGETPSAPQPYIEMPHLAIGLDRIDVRTELTEYQARTYGLGSQELAAEDGHEFVLAALKSFRGSFADGEPVATITADGESHDVTALADEARASSSGTLLVYAQVPVGAPVMLSIADEGRTVTMDLRTGAPVDDPDSLMITALYQRQASAPSGDLESAAVVRPEDDTLHAVFGDSDLTITVGLTGADARWLAWVGGDVGWAPEGEGFLSISGITMSSWLTGAGCVTSWNPSGSLTLTPDGGDPIAPLGSDIDSMLELQGQLLFRLPTEVDAATLTLAPQTTVNDECVLSTEFATASAPLDLS